MREEITATDITEKWMALRIELFTIMRDYEAKALALSTIPQGAAKDIRDMLCSCDREALLKIRREENWALREACFRHKREYDYLAGELTPMAHEIQAVLRPVSSMGVT
jgi:hypothetical protein